MVRPIYLQPEVLCAKRLQRIRVRMRQKHSRRRERESVPAPDTPLRHSELGGKLDPGWEDSKGCIKLAKRCSGGN